MSYHSHCVRLTSIIRNIIFTEVYAGRLTLSPMITDNIYIFIRIISIVKPNIIFKSWQINPTLKAPINALVLPPSPEKQSK
ncbi:hypothetical protein FKM82_000006 [Ascaphus truei]